MILLSWRERRQLLRVPDSPTTIALGTAWIGLFVSLWLSVQALAQVQDPQSLAPQGSCPFPIEWIQDGVSRLECHGSSLKARCAGLEPGDRVAFREENCVVEPDAMQAPMRLVASLKLNINHVKAKDLALLPGIGPGLSQAIVDYRENSGPLTSLDDLLKVRGIGKKRLSGLRNYLTCAKP